MPSQTSRLRELAEGVLVATSDMYMLNTTVIVAGSRCLVVDPGLLPAELHGLGAELASRGLVVEAGFSTHPHWDHLLWSSDLGQGPRYATRMCVGAVEKSRESVLDEPLSGASAKWYAEWEAELAGRLTAMPDEGRFSWSGPAADLIVHSGHAVGHCGLFFAELGVLVAGDMLSDIEVPGLDWDQADQLRAYRDGLSRLAALDGVNVVIPGHGRVGGGSEFQARAALDLRYLESLEGLQPFDDPRLTSWPPMQQQHQGNLDGFAKAHPSG
jgi:hydroxyacylglutathione hydrolase